MRILLLTFGFSLLVVGAYSLYGNLLPQRRGEVPPEPKALSMEQIESMSTAELSAKGASLIFYDPKSMTGLGKGICPMCHGFRPDSSNEVGPNLFGITKRAAERIKEARYSDPKASMQWESFPGSGRATTADEYIAESQICTSCYVVEGYGIKGSHDREAGGPDLNRKPISLTIAEMIAIHTYLYINDGVKPPDPKKLRAAYEKFIPISERRY